MKKLEKALIFKIDDSQYAIDSDSIIQILRVPEITKVPFTPKPLRGLCSIEGHIVPAFDTKQMILSDSVEGLIDTNNFKVRVLTIKYEDIQIALIVEEVIQNIDINPQNVEYSENEEDSSVIGVIKNAGEIIQILSIEKLLSNITMPEFIRKEKKTSNKKASTNIVENQNYSKYLLFEMDDEKFAVEIDNVREIIVNTKSITKIANANNEVIGMITLRDEVLVVLDLRVIFDKKVTFSDKNRILVIRNGKSIIGLLIDNIIDIKDIALKSIEKLPEKFRDNKVSGVVKIDDTLISIISNGYVNDLVSEANSSNESSLSYDNVETHQNESLIEVAIFSLANEEFAIDIEDVDEIIRYEGITPLLKAPKFVKGVINLRGEVIPIVSLQERLKFKEKITEDTKILVCTIGEMRIGFLVDNVSEVKDIPLEYITESDGHNNTFSHVIVLDNGDRMILKLKVDSIFKSEEISDLSTELVEG